MRRYESRARHAAHLDDRRHDDIRADISAGRYEPVSVGWPTLVVPTDPTYDPPIDGIMAFLEMGDT